MGRRKRQEGVEREKEEDGEGESKEKRERGNAMSQNNEKEQLSWREIWRINRRIFKICVGKRRSFFPIFISARIAEALSPYVTLYCSARFLDELTSARRPEMLVRWVLLILGLTAVMGLVKALLARLKDWEDALCHFWQYWIYGEKALDMDFAKAQ